MAANDFANKLGIRAGQHVYLEGAPAEFAAERLTGLPPGCRVATVLPNGARPDMVILWLKDKEGLEAVFQRLRHLIPPDGAAWEVIPKKKSVRPKGSAAPDFQDALAAALPTGLVDNKTLTFDDVEYGIRFVVRRELR
jgi:hypothetical protein